MRTSERLNEMRVSTRWLFYFGFIDVYECVAKCFCSSIADGILITLIKHIKSMLRMCCAPIICQSMKIDWRCFYRCTQVEWKHPLEYVVENITCSMCGTQPMFTPFGVNKKLNGKRVVERDKKRKKKHRSQRKVWFQKFNEWVRVKGSEKWKTSEQVSNLTQL